MTIKQHRLARIRLKDLHNEANQLEKIDHAGERDLLPHEWTRLISIYRDIQQMSANIIQCLYY